MASASYYVQGLAAFQAELKRMGAELPESLRAFNLTAGEKIVEEAKTLAHTKQQAKAAQSLRASKTTGYAAVKLGDNGRYAFARGAEFGARRYKQFPAWRGNQWMSWGGGPGYFLHPAIRLVGQTVLEDYWQSIRALRASAFPD